MTTAQKTMNLYKISRLAAYDLFQEDETASNKTLEEFIVLMDKMIDRSNQNNKSENTHKEFIESNY